MDLNPKQEGLWKVIIFLHITKWHWGCLQIQTLASMYMIGGWELPSLQNHTKKNPLHRILPAP
jgi:hypothetical protein